MFFNLSSGLHSSVENVLWEYFDPLNRLVFSAETHMPLHSYKSAVVSLAKLHNILPIAIRLSC